jgi:hypothetical protein
MELDGEQSGVDDRAASIASIVRNRWKNLGLNVIWFTRALDPGNYAACG